MSDLDEIREAFNKAIEMEAPARTAMLETLPEAIRSEVISLLDAHESAGLFLGFSEDAGPRGGERLGPYVLLEKIGQGGMGVVYRARRDDGEFQREVAIKLVGGRMFAPEAERRFIEERRILALLDHPNIVRMIDGGVVKGQRYLVMEFVSGLPVTVYCKERGLSVRDRLRLFQAVCSGIQYAHQHLILHRDLKPQNILVTPEGQVKILDFGIARLIDNEAADSATTILHPMTLTCASPEQVRGALLTLASDVYSLGLLLYELLTGVNPQSTGSQPEIMQRIAEVDPPAPGKIASGLPTDLDAVVVKALSKEASRRYTSAEEMSAEVGRILENRPVLARTPSWTYYFSRFLVRNKALTAVAAGLTIAVLAGLIAFSWQAHRAEKQRLIAERRFDEARRIIHTIIHEIQPKLIDINGTVLLRKSLIEETVVYLDALGKDAGDNPALMRELIEAYLELAIVSGDDSTANAGDHPRTTQALAKAGALANALSAADPSNPASLRTLVNYYREASKDAEFYGTSEKALAYARQGLAAAERLAAKSSDESVQELLASAITRVGNADPDLDKSIHLFERSLTIWERALSLRPSDRVRTNMALMYKTLSGAWSNKGDQRRALDYAQRARVLDEELLAKNPSSPGARMALAFDIGAVAWAYFCLSDYPRAAENMRQNVALRESVVAANPGDGRAEDRLAWALRDLAMAQRHLGEFADERRSLVRVMEIYGRHAGSGSLSSDSLKRFALCHYDVGQLELHAGRKSAACGWFRKASTLLDQYEARVGRLDDDVAETDPVRRAAGACRDPG